MLNVGDQIGRWTIVGELPCRNHRRQWRCRCSCGTERAVLDQALKDGTSQSCGCLMKEMAAGRIKTLNLTHGKSRSPEYAAWCGMIGRCFRVTSSDFKNYGARGITVCDLWRNSFEAFLADLGRRPSPRHSLERIKNELGYFPGNVRWATSLEQNRNKRSNRLLTVGGVTRCISEWAKLAGVSRWKIEDGLTRGLTAEQAVAAAGGGVHAS